MMKKISAKMIEKYYYDSDTERIKHVEEMQRLGWEAHSKIRKFIGDINVDDVTDENNYMWYAEFKRHY